MAIKATTTKTRSRSKTPVLKDNKKASKSRNSSATKDRREISEELSADIATVPEKIIRLSHAYLESAVLLAAVQIGVFSLLAAEGPMTHIQLRRALGLNPRATPDFPAALLAMKLLQRKGDGDDALYSNTPETDIYLDKRKATYIGKYIEQCIALYDLCVDHHEMIKASNPGNEKLKTAIREFKTVAKVQNYWLLVQLKQQSHPENDKSSIRKSPDEIFERAFSFYQSRMLLTACQLDLFTIIEKAPKRKMSSKTIARVLGMDSSTASGFVNMLVTTEMLRREKDPKTNTYNYCNTPECLKYLDRKKEDGYIGGLLRVFGKYHYKAAGSLVDTLKTGNPQMASRDTTLNFYNALYNKDPGSAHEVARGAMSVMHEASLTFSQRFSLRKYRTVLDIGGGAGHFAARLAQANPKIQCTITDLPDMVPVTKRFIDRRWSNVKDRLSVMEHDFLKEDTFPATGADVISMTMVMMQWGLEVKKMLVRKAYETLPKGGILVVIDHFVTDDERRYDNFGLCKSLLMFLIHGSQVGGQTGEDIGGRTFTFAEYTSWCTEAGFKQVKMTKLPGQPMLAGVAYK